MAEVGVGGEPDVLGLKFEDGFHGLYVSAKVKFFPNPCKSLQGLQRFGNVRIIAEEGRVLNAAFSSPAPKTQTSYQVHRS